MRTLKTSLESWNFMLMTACKKVNRAKIAGGDFLLEGWCIMMMVMMMMVERMVMMAGTFCFRAIPSWCIMMKGLSPVFTILATRPRSHKINGQFSCALLCTFCFVRFILFCFSLSHYVDCRIFGHCNQWKYAGNVFMAREKVISVSYQKFAKHKSNFVHTTNSD